jgi:glycerate kinase
VRILIAPDKFKGSLSAYDAAERIAAGFRRSFPRAMFDLAPVSDGGEGFLDAIATAGDAEWIKVKGVADALGRPRTVPYLWLPGSKTAVIELARAAGWGSVKGKERSPLHTTTLGVGQLMLAAARQGAARIIVGLGGSATNDAGAGIGQALGFRFIDRTGVEVELGGLALGKVARVIPPDEFILPPVVAAVDVANPLCGPNGASRVFGPQKGGSPKEVVELDRALKHFSAKVNRELALVPGAGAAGGSAYGLMAFAGAGLCPGFDLVADAMDLKARFMQADLIVTGEGALDHQSLFGKVPYRLKEWGKKYRKPVVFLAGTVDRSHFSAAFSLVPGPVALDQALHSAGPWLEEQAAQVAATLVLGRSLGGTS